MFAPSKPPNNPDTVACAGFVPAIVPQKASGVPAAREARDCNANVSDASGLLVSHEQVSAMAHEDLGLLWTSKATST